MLRRRHCAARQGKITLVTIFAILGLVVLAGFIGNAGHVVTAKVNSQNAADAIAFSSAQWMARGMNAATATNHLLGEATALVVVLEALGGPEADAKMEAYPAPSRITDSINQNMYKLAIIDGLPIYGAKLARQIDEPFVRAIVMNLVSRKGDSAKHKAFATIYDSKLMLKKATSRRLLVKAVANAGLWVPPPWGWFSAIPAYGVHVYLNKELLEIGIEYVILEGLERLVAALPVIREVKVEILEKRIIPALAAHGDYLAGRPSLIAKNRPASDSSVVNNAIRDSLEHLGEVYQVKAAIYPTAKTYPFVAHMRLPIVPEAPPSMEGTASNKYEKEWGEDEIVIAEKDDPVAELRRKMAENRKKTENEINRLKARIKALEDLNEQVEDLKTRAGVNDEERQAFQAEQDKIAADIAKNKQKLTDREKELAEIKAQQKKIDEAVAEMEQAGKKSGN